MNNAGAMRPLPIHIRPNQGETAESYLRRLARANHLRPSYLRAYLNGPYHRYSPIQPERLAALADRPVTALQHALSDLTPRPRHQRPQPRSDRRTTRHAERAEIFGAIRYTARTEDLSIRAMATRFGVHRRTIRQALAAPTPPARKKHIRSSHALTGLHGHIDVMLHADPTIPAGHIWEQLVDHHDATASYSSVRNYVASQRGSRSENKAGSDKID
jgi:lambda repressor-like predicted transcriptional regulator